MGFWTKKVNEEEHEVTTVVNHGLEDVRRAKEIVDVAIALYKSGVESSEEAFKHIEVKYDVYSRLAYFYFLTDEIKKRFLEVREYKVNDKPIIVDDYYKCSHIIGLLKRYIKIEKDRVMR